MSKLDELIRELCPNGVEYKRLGDIASISRGGSFQKKDFVLDGFPCIHYGQIYTKYGLFADETISFIDHQAAEKQKFAYKNDIIMAVTSENIEDVCKCIAWLGDETVAVSGHTAIIHHTINPKYLVYYLHSAHFRKQKVKLAHGTKVIEVKPADLNEVSLPVPPMEVQSEIVRVLDNFTLLTAELTAELTARKKQYEYYRNHLLTFKSTIKTAKLSDVAKISRGKRVVKAELNDDYRYPVYQNSLAPMGFYRECNYGGGKTYVISAGAAGEIGFCKTDFWAADDCLVLDCHEGLEDKYIYYYLMSKQEYIKQNVRKASIPRLSRETIEKMEIPLPDLDIQKRIVSVLDNFDAICSDLNIGLPAEIKARQKQYEYYRDALLTYVATGSIIPQTDRQTDRQTEPN